MKKKVQILWDRVLTADEKTFVIQECSRLEYAIREGMERTEMEDTPYCAALIQMEAISN